jgi:hypothetical protein
MPVVINGRNVDITPRRSIFLSAGGGVARITAGCNSPISVEMPTNKQNVYLLGFDKDTIQYSQWGFVMPDNYNGGTITSRFYWSALSGSGDVVWRIRGIAYNDSDALDQAFGTEVSATDTLLTAGDVHITPETSTFTLAGNPAGGSFVVIQVDRFASDGADSLTANAALFGAMLKYGTTRISD